MIEKHCDSTTTKSLLQGKIDTMTIEACQMAREQFDAIEKETCEYIKE